MDTVIFVVYIAAMSFFLGYKILGPSAFSRRNRNWKDLGLILLNDFRLILAVGLWFIVSQALVLLYVLVYPGALGNSWLLQDKDKAEAIGIALLITASGAGTLTAWAKKYQGLRHRLIFWK